VNGQYLIEALDRLHSALDAALEPGERQKIGKAIHILIKILQKRGVFVGGRNLTPRKS
jgi:hypothetical protein